MADEKVDVELRLQARRFNQQIGKATGAIKGLSKSLLGVAGAYVGIQAAQAAVGGLITSTVDYTNQIQKMQIGLTSVVSAVDNLPWESAEKKASSVFDQLKEMSLATPAGPKDMLDIFQNIVGPLRNAGTEMDRITKITNKAVLASSALGIDYEQAARDMQLMARGGAGMDVKLFSLLRATGAIAESTEEWNKGLSDTERVNKLEAALDKFAGSGDAFGSSWSGVTSSFKGIVDELKRAAATPILASVAKILGKINKHMVDNRAQLEKAAEVWGTKIGGTIEHLANNWREILDKGIKFAKTMGPILIAMQAAQMAGGLVGAIGGAKGMVGGFLGAGKKGKPSAGKKKKGGGIFGAIAGTFKGHKKKMQKPDVGGKGDFGMGSLDLGWVDTIMAGFLTVGTGAGSLKASFAAVAAAAWPIVAAMTVIAGIGIAVFENFELMSGAFAYLSEAAQPVIVKVTKFAKDMWSFLKPALEAIGLILIAVLIPAFELLMAQIEFTIDAIDPLVQIFVAIGSAITDNLLPSLRELIFFLTEQDTAAKLKKQEAFEKQEDPTNLGLKTSGTMGSPNIGVMMDTTQGLAPPPPKRSGGGGKKTPGGRGGTNINVDRMVVKQEFKGKYDPDRVVADFSAAITKQSDRRVFSSTTPILSR